MIIRKSFTAEIAHRVLGAYTTKCQGVHGHSYTIEVFMEENSLDTCGMVLDFKLVKEKLWLLAAMDHTLIIWDKDQELVNLARILSRRYIIVPYNTTAEHMSMHILRQAQVDHIPVIQVIVHETTTGMALCKSTDVFSMPLEEVLFSDELLARI